MKARLRCLGLAVPLLAASLGAEETPKSLAAQRTRTAPRMDGRLSEPAWASAPAASGFTVSWPEFGKPAGLPTEVRVLYDDHFLYVGARMHHPKGQAAVIRRLHRRDQSSMSDWFVVYIDSLRERRTAWGFAVNAAGVQRDTVHAGDATNDFNGGGDASWDGVWESAVSVDADGWSAELKIPLSLLRIRPGQDSQTWGINFSRTDHGPVRETSYWELSPRGVNAFVSRFPDLTGIEGLQPQLRREWVPYVSVQRKFETSQPYDDRGWTTRAGLDARLGLTTNSQLDLSIRPDFGQVEVDQAVLNLSTYETFLPEKRPFFLEGMEIFQVSGNTLFYSRRIGKGLSDPELGEGETLVDRPMASEINGAAKVTAKLGSGLNLGVLGANIAQAEAVVKDAGGQEVDREIYPATTAAVVRLQQRVSDSGSYVGGFASYLRQASDTGREASVLALDSVLKSADRSTTTELAFAHSEAGTRQDQAAGHRERVRFNRQWRTGWSLELQATNASRTYNPNDLGFLNRADNQTAYLGAVRKWDATFGVIRNLELGMDSWGGRDQAGRVYDRGIGGLARTDFTNFWSTWIKGGVNLAAWDDRELRTFAAPEKKYLHTPQIPWMEAGFDTAGNRPWYVRFEVERSWHEGGPSTDTSLYQSIKLNSAVEIQLNTVVVRDTGERKYLETQGAVEGVPGSGTPIVGLRALSLLDQTLRFSYALSPTFTIQLFSQWLDANYAYRDLRTWVDEDTLAPGAASSATAFSERVWNVNLITRWEFRPGSTAFLVYTHGVATDALANDHAALSPANDLRPLRSLPSDDVVQLKVSWLFR